MPTKIANKTLNFNKSDLIPFTFVTTSGRVSKVLEYVDRTTGEIVKAEDSGIREVYPNYMQQRNARLNSLNKSTRELAVFILAFRNTARGFLVSVERIIDWYAMMTNKRKDNIQRSIDVLVKAGILDSDMMLNEIFMINNPNRTLAETKGEVCRAYAIFDALRFHYKDSSA